MHPRFLPSETKAKPNAQRRMATSRTAVGLENLQRRIPEAAFLRAKTARDPRQRRRVIAVRQLCIVPRTREPKFSPPCPAPKGLGSAAPSCPALSGRALRLLAVSAGSLRTIAVKFESSQTAPKVGQMNFPRKLLRRTGQAIRVRCAQCGGAFGLVRHPRFGKSFCSQRCLDQRAAEQTAKVEQERKRLMNFLHRATWHGERANGREEGNAGTRSC